MVFTFDVINFISVYNETVDNFCGLNIILFTEVEFLFHSELDKFNDFNNITVHFGTNFEVFDFDQNLRKLVKISVVEVTQTNPFIHQFVWDLTDLSFISFDFVIVVLFTNLCHEFNIGVFAPNCKINHEEHNIKTVVSKNCCETHPTHSVEVGDGCADGVGVVGHDLFQQGGMGQLADEQHAQQTL